MAVLSPAVATVRTAVRRQLVVEPLARPPALLLVACSGGADSLALAVAAGFVAPRLGLRCGLVTVDHGLQEGSAGRAAGLASWAGASGFDPVLAVAVDVTRYGGGPEAAARGARYQALAEAATGVGAAAVLLGHTREDQAETVLLALARGAGPRGMAGMPARRVMHGVPFLRPLLDVARADTRACCAALGLETWEDPHNVDPGYTRARLRTAMPVLVEALGPAVVANLARTAELLAADGEVLDAAAGQAGQAARDGGAGLSARVLAGLPVALRRRVLHRWALDLGVSGSALSYRHVTALEALVTDWHGQGPVALPGGILARRCAGRLVVGA